MSKRVTPLPYRTEATVRLYLADFHVALEIIGTPHRRHEWRGDNLALHMTIRKISCARYTDVHDIVVFPSTNRTHRLLSVGLNLGLNPHLTSDYQDVSFTCEVVTDVVCDLPLLDFSPIKLAHLEYLMSIPKPALTRVYWECSGSAFCDFRTSLSRDTKTPIRILSPLDRCLAEQL